MVRERVAFLAQTFNVKLNCFLNVALDLFFSLPCRTTSRHVRGVCGITAFRFLNNN